MACPGGQRAGGYMIYQNPILLKLCILPEPYFHIFSAIIFQIMELYGTLFIFNNKLSEKVENTL